MLKILNTKKAFQQRNSQRKTTQRFQARRKSSEDGFEAQKQSSIWSVDAHVTFTTLSLYGRLVR